MKIREKFRRWRNKPSVIRAATWNVNHGTTEREFRRDLTRVLWKGRHPDVLLLQEVKPHKGHLHVLRDWGFEYAYYEPEFCIAWNPHRFELSNVVEWEGEHEYWTEPRFLMVTLWDKLLDRKVRFLTYHTPAHVQRKDHGRWRNIWPALAETDKMWDRIAARSAYRGEIPFIAGGDDNFDGKKGWLPRFLRRLLRGAAREVRANRPTHHRRFIDDFRINKLVKVIRRSKRVIKGLASDHNAFVCDFRLK